MSLRVLNSQLLVNTTLGSEKNLNGGNSLPAKSLFK